MRNFAIFQKFPLALLIATISVTGCTSVARHQSEADQHQQAVKWSAESLGQDLALVDLSRSLSDVIHKASQHIDTKVVQDVALTKAVEESLGHDQAKIAPAIAEIKKSAKNHGVPPTLLAAVASHESGFKPHVRSRGGAVGLFQVLPHVWSGKCTGLSTIKGNVDCGARVLSFYYEQAGNWTKALALYNVGPGNYSRSKQMRSKGNAYAKDVLKGKRKIENALADIRRDEGQAAQL